MTTDPLPLKGVPKAKICKVCAALAASERPKGHPLAAPYPGPRCHRHDQLARKAGKAKKAATQLVARFGMPQWFRDRLWAYQGRTCAICHRAKGITKTCALDHDHKLPDGQASWRGLCCAKCNTYLGWIRDDQDTVRRLLRYLEDPPAQQLLREIARERTQQLIDDAWEVK